MAGITPDQAKKAAKKKAQKDLSLNEVEHLKDRLHKHLKEIRKLNPISQEEIDDADLSLSDSETSSEDEDLSKQIAAIKIKIGNTGAMLRGDAVEELLNESIDLGSDDPKHRL